MKTRNIISSAGLLAATALGLSSTATAQDTYTGGIGVAVLIENFNLAGANAIGANFAFQGNPATPVVNSTTDFGLGAGVTPIFDVSNNVIGGMVVTSVDNGDGTQTVSMTVTTGNPSIPLVNAGTNTEVMTAQGPQTATDFVMDIGNGFGIPGYPADGVVTPLVADGQNLDIDLKYFRQNVDGSFIEENGCLSPSCPTDSLPFIYPNSEFWFAWGFDLAEAQAAYTVGFAATFEIGVAPCLGDLNGDLTVDGADIGLLLGDWGNGGPGDLNDSGTTDGADIGILLSAWGDTCL
jgi:hypothetical protein